MSPNGRPRVRTVVVVAIVIALALTGLTVVFTYNVRSPASSSQSSSSAASTSHASSSSQTSSSQSIASSSSGGLKIANAIDDVTVLGESNVMEVLVSNFSTIADKTSMVGTPGENFTVDISLDFQACPCVHQVTEVDSLTPGFTVEGTTPSLPVSFTGGGGDFYMATFSVQVMAPSTPYSGNMTLFVHVQ